MSSNCNIFTFKSPVSQLFGDIGRASRKKEAGGAALSNSSKMDKRDQGGHVCVVGGLTGGAASDVV